MCGIAGFWRFGGGHPADLAATASDMAGRIRHRGPDHEKSWSDGSAGVALAFQRLSIIDLSVAGAQPMTSASGRYVIAFNGEIYNFRRLRSRLEADRSAPAWRGHSDTEVLLACLEAWGSDRTLREVIGMFAFALWDAREKRLLLARDRAGEKPLYFAASREAFVFASELKALEAYPSFERRISPDAAALYARFGYVPSPHAIYAGVSKLAPGAVLTVDSEGSVRQTSYWDAAEVAVRCAAERFSGTADEAADELESLLGDAVAIRTESDVPLGIFLSGGVDSGLATALLQRQSASRLNTFTIGFHDSGLDEAPAAAKIARHLGTNHHELYVRPEELLDLVPTAVDAYDEPFADSSSIPTFLVARTARSAVTVAIGGDGGDELFAGYHRHFLGRRLQRRVSLVPRPLRHVAARALETMPRSERARHLARGLRLSDPIASYYENVLQRGAASPATVPLRNPPSGLDDPTEAIMFLDFTSYLPDDILVKVDRATMAVSLELRTPYLDHRVIEFAWRLPLSMKIRRDRGKWILKRILERHVPGELMTAEKKGFGVPLAEWLRGPLRSWAEPLLAAQARGEAGPFDPAAVSRLWQQHLAGSNHASILWTVLMFESWRRRTGATA